MYSRNLAKQKNVLIFAFPNVFLTNVFLLKLIVVSKTVQFVLQSFSRHNIEFRRNFVLQFVSFLPVDCRLIPHNYKPSLHVDLMAE
jgi:hypothetical protein